MSLTPRGAFDGWVDPASGLASSSTGNGPPVVLLHGLGGFRDLWRDQIEPLTNAGFRAIAVDLPGHGDSPAQPDMSIPSIAHALAVLFETLSIQRAAVIGHSMGGRTMFQFAITNPERIWAIVPVGAQSESPTGEYRTTLEGVRDATKLGGLEAFKVAFWQAGEIPERTERDADYASWYWSHFERNCPASLVRAFDAILAMPMLTSRLGEIHVPALCVVGSRDLPFLPLARRYEELIPQCRTLVIDDCHHYPMTDAAARFSSALVEFLLASAPAVGK